MACCMSGCPNDRRTLPQNTDITFHRLHDTTDSNNLHFKITTRSKKKGRGQLICSDHFDDDDFITTDDSRKLKPTARPRDKPKSVQKKIIRSKPQNQSKENNDVEFVDLTSNSHDDYDQPPASLVPVSMSNVNSKKRYYVEPWVQDILKKGVVDVKVLPSVEHSSLNGQNQQKTEDDDNDDDESVLKQILEYSQQNYRGRTDIFLNENEAKWWKNRKNTVPYPLQKAQKTHKENIEKIRKSEIDIRRIEAYAAKAKATLEFLKTLQGVEDKQFVKDALDEVAGVYMTESDEYDSEEVSDTEYDGNLSVFNT